MTRRGCGTCQHARLSIASDECNGCFGTEDHPKWAPESDDANGLRDEFAKAALYALIAKAETYDQPLAAMAESYAKCAYIIADAMLKARGE